MKIQVKAVKNTLNFRIQAIASGDIADIGSDVGMNCADTIRTVEGYSDIIVMRHFESGAAKRATSTASIPVINIGDGPGQHTTQV